jgi:hypothetical protein
VCAWDTKPEQSHQEDVPTSTTYSRNGRLPASSYYYVMDVAAVLTLLADALNTLG